MFNLQKYGFNNVSDAYVIDKLPNGLIFNDADGDYNPNSGVWNIGKLKVGQNVTLTIKTIVNITNISILNVATVNSSTHNPNEDNNRANNTTSVRHHPGHNNRFHHPRSASLLTKTSNISILYSSDYF